MSVKRFSDSSSIKNSFKLSKGATSVAKPATPTVGSATNVGTSQSYNGGSATVTYTAATLGGAATSFTATSSPGSFTGTGSSPITVLGLQSDTAYTFTVKATNANGDSTESESTSSITATTVPQALQLGHLQELAIQWFLYPLQQVLLVVLPLLVIQLHQVHRSL